MMKNLRIFLTMLLLSIVSVGFAGTIVFGDLELENGVQYTAPFDGGDFTVTFAGGVNDGKYYTSGSGIRVYGGGTMTIAAKSGNVKQIKITYDGNNKPTSNDVVNTGSYTASTGVWTGNSNKVVFTRPSGNGHWRVKIIEVTVVSGVTKEPAELSFGENTSFTVEANASFTAPELDNPNGLDVTYSSSDEEIASVDENTGEVTIGSKEGTATITASSDETDDYYAGTATYTITVFDPNGPGSEGNPYSVADAIAYINTLGTASSPNVVYVKGVISQIDEVSVEHGNATYWISDDGGTTVQMEVYRGKYLDNENFESEDQIAVGDEVIVCGMVKKYNKIPEFNQGNYIVDIKHSDLAAAELAYPVEAFTAILGEDNTFPVLANPNELLVTYTSSNEDVATIDAEGNITLVAVGTTTIAAKSEKTSEFLAGNASYVLTVNELVIPGTDKYELVTDASTLAEGDEIIIAVDEESLPVYAMGGQKNTNRAAVEVTYNDDDTLTPNSDAQIITLEGDENGWYFNVGNAYLYAASSSSNHLKTEAEADADGNAKASIEIDENGGATIVFQGSNTRNHMRFNPNNGSPMFSCYLGTSSVATLPRIYKKVQETVPVTISAAEYATLYYSDKAFEIPEGVTAQIVTGVSEKSIELEALESIIPAGTGVVLNGPEGTYDFKVVNDNSAAPENNKLKGSDEAATTEGGDKYYKLAVKDGKAGFFWGAEEGGAFENGAHKAYLALSADEAKEMGYFFDGLVTEIRSIGTETVNGDIYTIGGVRVKADKLQKGIYIVNGKKMVVK